MGETVVPPFYSKNPAFCTNNTCPMKKYCLLKRRNFDKRFKDARYETYTLMYFNHWKSGGGYKCSARTRHKFILEGTLQFLTRWGYKIIRDDLVKPQFWSSGQWRN